MPSIQVPEICEDSSPSPNHELIPTEKIKLCSALHPNCDSFITSANPVYIPAPPPIDCPFMLRSDFRLGAVDPIQTPQMIDSENLFYTTIPSCPMDNDIAHPYLKYKYMWTNATDKDIVFAEEDRTLSGVASLSERFYRRLHAAVRYVIKRSEEARDPPVEPWTFGTRDRYLEYLMKRPNLLQRVVKDGPLLMNMGIHRLETLKLDPGTIFLTVGMIQSFWIELCGALDYVQFFRDTIEPYWKVRHRAHGLSRPALCHLMGGFTTSEYDSKRITRAGIPMYLIRPLRTLSSREILDTVGLTYLPIETELAIGLYSPITTDTASDSRKIFAYNHFLYTDHFSTTYGRWPLLAPAISGSIRSVTQNPPSSTLKNSTQHLDRFLELTGDYAPPAINSWFHANAVNVNRFSAKSQQYKHLPSDASYFFPDPHLFLDVSERERVVYLHMWKQISAFWKYKASCNKPDARPLSSEEWRDLLSIPSKASTASEIQKKVEVFLGPSPDSNGVSYHLDVFDFNLPIEKKEAVELVWEICELNFRFELLSLDVRAAARSIRSQVTGDEYFQADNKSQVVFPRCLPITTIRSSELRDLVNALESKVQKAKVLEEANGRALEKESRVSVAWEQGLVQHYVQTFYDYFGRPAILPRRNPSE
ncbi:hypothetical protein EDD18DRAFT_1413661 [Armillaria luteobubalina]|uniref:Uncharacterized protein n=1 Tax=Armillaria luteobubalina TaxID=153913 RepID=A0AA39TJY3_9AGAR|nr:hypothetical protein EDD18DRAFT_1413661 [Armillaria luteobubalina]